jgi:hypothetical protein
MTQTMQTNYDCGPVAAYNALKKLLGDKFTMTYQEFLIFWKFPNAGTFKDNLRDQPGDHLTVLRNLKVLHRRVTIDQLLDAKCPEGATVVLVHDPEDPYTKQHWVRFLGFNRLSALYSFDWGNGTTRRYSRDKVYELFTAGAPDYAYCLGESEPSKISRAANWAWLRLRDGMKKLASWI